MPTDLTKARQLFGTFSKIGAFTFGGGYAMIPLIQREVTERRRWLEDRDILDIVAIAESTPGPIAINTATFVGYQVCGTLGAFCATLGVVLPSFVLILLVSAAFRSLLGYPAVRAALQGIKPCLAGLILAAGVGLCSDAVFSGGSADPVAAAVLGALLLGELASLGLRKKPLAPGALIGASAVMGIALSLI